MKTTITKKEVLCKPEDSVNGFKGQETILLEALNAYYSHRKGFTIPHSKLPLLQALLSGSWRAKSRFLTTSPIIFVDLQGNEYTYQQAKRKLSGGIPKPNSRRFSATRALFEVMENPSNPMLEFERTGL
jgi:hypothetical protein